MGLILHIETSTKNCSVSIANNGHFLSLVEEHTKNHIHAEKLHQFIQYAVEGANINLSELEAICVSKGPGSYTGLRIGISSAKGLCYGLKIPMMSIDTLTIMVQKVFSKDGLLIPMIDAKQEKVYTAIFNHEKKMLTPITIKTVEKNIFKDYSKQKILIFGDGAINVENLFNFKYITNIYPSSKYMISLAEKLFQQKKFENIIYFEPFYLKDFI